MIVLIGDNSFIVQKLFSPGKELYMRYTNRRVANTEEMAQSYTVADFAVFIDWLEFTVCGLSLAAVLEDILGLSMNQIIHTGGGNYGYRDK